MIDRIFGALLIACLLAGGTAAIGSALIIDAPPAPPVLTATLPEVTVTGKREPASSPLARNDADVEPTARQLQ